MADQLEAEERAAHGHPQPLPTKDDLEGRDCAESGGDEEELKEAGCLGKTTTAAPSEESDRVEPTEPAPVAEDSGAKDCLEDDASDCAENDTLNHEMDRAMEMPATSTDAPDAAVEEIDDDASTHHAGFHLPAMATSTAPAEEEESTATEAPAEDSVTVASANFDDENLGERQNGDFVNMIGEDNVQPEHAVDDVEGGAPTGHDEEHTLGTTHHHAHTTEELHGHEKTVATMHELEELILGVKDQTRKTHEESVHMQQWAKDYTRDVAALNKKLQQVESASHAVRAELVGAHGSLKEKVISDLQDAVAESETESATGAVEDSGDETPTPPSADAADEETSTSAQPNEEESDDGDDDAAPTSAPEEDSDAGETESAEEDASTEQPSSESDGQPIPDEE